MGPMTAAKAWTALLTVVVMAMIRQYAGLDFKALGLNDALTTLVGAGVDGVVAFFMTWLIPNAKRAMKIGGDQ